MGTREGRKTFSSLPQCRASEMEDKKLWDVAEKLQRLIVSHDKAVQQMYLLDTKLRDLENRLSLLKRSGYPGLTQHWYVRIGLVEWTRDMYDEYRLRKWSDIQDLISEIFMLYDAEEVMTVLLMAEVSARSIGIFMENEEEDTSITSDSDDSHVEEEMMLVEGEEDNQNSGVVNIMDEDEEMEDEQNSVVPAL